MTNAAALISRDYPNPVTFNKEAAAGFIPKLVANFQKGRYAKPDGAGGLEPCTFDDLLTYADAGTPTVKTNAQGVLVWTAHNKIDYSEDFTQASWAKSRTSVVGNAASGPLPGMPADKLVEDSTASNTHRVYETISSNGEELTFAVFLKSAERSLAYLRLTGPGGVTSHAWFNLGAGTLGTVQAAVTAEMEGYGNGWYLCKITMAETNPAAVDLLIGLTTADNSTVYTGDGSSGIFMAGAHCYRSDLDGMDISDVTGTTYVKTTGSPVFRPRLNHYVKPATKWKRHNIMPHAYEMIGQDWFEVAASPAATTRGFVADQVRAVNHTRLGRLTESSGTDLQRTFWAGSAAFIIGSTYRWAVDVKVDPDSPQERFLHLRLTSNLGAIFDPSDGSVFSVGGSGLTVSSRNMGGGIYRCWIEFVASVSNEVPWAALATNTGGTDYAGDGQSGFFCGNFSLTNRDFEIDGREFLPTFGTAVAPEQSLSTYANEGILIEGEARTNVFTRYLADSTSGLNVSGATVVASGWDFGLDSAFELVDGVTGYVYRSAVSLPLTPHAFSCFVETEDGGIPIFDHPSVSGPSTDFIFVANSQPVPPSSVDYNVTHVAGNVYFVWAVTIPSAAGPGATGIIKYSGNKARDLKVSGIQIEEGSVPSSPIVTQGAAVTRGAEALTIAGANVPWAALNYKTAADYPELVNDPVFDGGSADWVFEGTATDTSAAGYLEGTTGGVTSQLAYTTITTVPGRRYSASVDILAGTGAGTICAGTTAFSANLGIATYVGAGNTTSFTFIATGTLTYLTLFAGSSNYLLRVDNVTCREAAEKVENGGFDADSAWDKLEAGTTSNPPTIAGGVATLERVDGTNFGYLAQTLSLTEGVVYEVSLDISNTSARVRIGDSALGTQALSVTESNVGTGKTYQFVARASNVLTLISGTNGVDSIVDNISVRELSDDYGVSIAMKGTVSYADENSGATLKFLLWQESINNRIYHYLNTVGSETGEVSFLQNSAGVQDFVVSDPDSYESGLNVPFSIASYHKPNGINGAVNGTALTEDTTPVSLADLSTTDIELLKDSNGTLREFRVWDQSIGDAGIAAASL